MSTTTKPKALPVCPDSIPLDLRALACWVVWRYVEERDPETGELDFDKPPLNARGGAGSSTNPKTWSAFDVALAAYLTGKFDGLGFALHVKRGEDGEVLVGADLDHCRNPQTGEIEPWAQDIIAALNSYTEVSPSGEGIRIFLRGKLPPHGRKRGNFECYCTGRYVTVTGQHVEGTPMTIESREAELLAVHKQFWPEHHEPKETGATSSGQPVGLTDLELIEKAKKSKHGDRFQELWEGGLDGKPSASEADLALCDRLGWWTRYDSQRVDQLFRQSGRMRSKWNRSDYRERTLRKACEGKSGGYEPRRSRALLGDHHANGNGDDGHHRQGKPTIILGTDEYRVNDEAIDALSNPAAVPEVYQRGNLLVRVLRTPKAGKQSRVDRPEGTPRIGKIPGPHLSELLARVADFVTLVPKKDGETELAPAHPPARCISAVLSRGHYPKIRCLEAVVEAPALRPDGTILDTPGWDAETGLLYEPNGDFPKIPQTPDKMQAIRCATHLLELVENFPFAGESEDERYNHRAAWLAALLTTMVRFAIHGPCPLFLFDANCAGTGKTLLTDAIAIIATGRGMSRTAFPNDETELRKRITSIALAGDRLMLFDNIPAGCPFGGAALDAALTGTTWQDRLLGFSEMTPELPLNTVFYATGNNIMLTGDAQRRVIPCRLETDVEKPEERTDFKYPELLEHVRAHRAEYVCDGLTILRAFAAAGSPQAALPNFGSYEAWSRLVRQAVYWVMCADPWATREKIRTADPTLNTLAALLEGWQELPGGRSGISVAETLRILNNPDHKDNFTILRGALMEWSKNDKLPGAGTIGCKLRSYRKRVMDGRYLDAQSGHAGVQNWKVVTAA
jgi:hypothetical protein